MRVLRARLLETLHTHYIRTAREGRREFRVLARHALPNVLAPTIIMLAMDAGTAIGISIYVEVVYHIHGLGHSVLTALSGEQGYDLPLILGVMFISATAIIALNAIADVVARMIDPRITTVVALRARAFAQGLRSRGTTCDPSSSTPRRSSIPCGVPNSTRGRRRRTARSACSAMRRLAREREAGRARRRGSRAAGVSRVDVDRRVEPGRRREGRASTSLVAHAHRARGVVLVDDRHRAGDDPRPRPHRSDRAARGRGRGLRCRRLELGRPPPRRARSGAAPTSRRGGARGGHGS